MILSNIRDKSGLPALEGPAPVPIVDHDVQDRTLVTAGRDVHATSRDTAGSLQEQPRPGLDDLVYLGPSWPHERAT